jgi:hypothetical protein
MTTKTTFTALCTDFIPVIFFSVVFVVLQMRKANNNTGQCQIYNMAHW